MTVDAHAASDGQQTSELSASVPASAGSSAPLNETREMVVLADVLESCLPDDEGYDDDTAQVIGNVIARLRSLAAAAGAPEGTDG